MKKIFGTSVFMVFLIVSMTQDANATLFNRGNGLIYDSVQNLTWVQDPLAAVNFVKHTSQGGNGPSFSTTLSPDGRNNFGDSAIIGNTKQLNYKGHNDWRRPNSAPLPSGLTLNEIIASANTVGNELYNLFNTAGNDLSLFTLPTGGWVFWSSNLQLADPAHGLFSNNGVFQFNTQTKTNTLVNRQFILSSEWVVRDGDVSAVPLPPSILLLCSGLVPLLATKRKSTR